MEQAIAMSKSASGWAARELFGPHIDVILKTIAHAFDCCVGELKGKERTARIVTPRLVAYYLMRRLTGLSYPELGRIFDRDHTTIMNGCKRIEHRLMTEVALTQIVMKLAIELEPTEVAAE